MLEQIASFLVDTGVTFLVYLLLARFHFQWLRVPFRNPIGQFVLALTSWAVVPARRVVPSLAGLDLATLLLAWLVQALGLWALFAIAGRDPALSAIAAVAAVDLVRYSVYILVFAVILHVAITWINPDAPAEPLLAMMTRPFLRPLRRYVPPVANVDLTPMVLIVILYVLLIPLNYLRLAAAGL
ncbi:MAG TPA: YggT family protein [Burkholderiales bacterium]|nr:YggT family protein [Burkholderiales bacterium]